jgi:hypothetical protein
MDYKYTEFQGLANMAGEYPVEVYYGTINIGILQRHRDSYTITEVSGPRGNIRMKQGPKNKFTNREKAAKILHYSWKLARENKL